MCCYFSETQASDKRGLKNDGNEEKVKTDSTTQGKVSDKPAEKLQEVPEKESNDKTPMEEKSEKPDAEAKDSNSEKTINEVSADKGTSGIPEKDTSTSHEKDTSTSPEKDTSTSPEKDSSTSPEKDTSTTLQEDTHQNEFVIESQHTGASTALGSTGTNLAEKKLTSLIEVQDKTKDTNDNETEDGGDSTVKAESCSTKPESATTKTESNPSKPELSTTDAEDDDIIKSSVNKELLQEALASAKDTAL